MPKGTPLTTSQIHEIWKLSQRDILDHKAIAKRVGCSSRTVDVLVWKWAKESPVFDVQVKGELDEELAKRERERKANMEQIWLDKRAGIKMPVAGDLAATGPTGSESPKSAWGLINAMSQLVHFDLRSLTVGEMEMVMEARHKRWKDGTPTTISFDVTARESKEVE